jgi:hypothetical protein
MVTCKRRCRYLLCLTVLQSLLPAAANETGESAPAKPEPVLQVSHRGMVRAVVFSPDGRWLASGAKDGTIKIWEISSGRLLRTIYGHGSAGERSGGKPRWPHPSLGRWHHLGLPLSRRVPQGRPDCGRAAGCYGPAVGCQYRQADAAFPWDLCSWL